jgi:hypothetical protein
VERKQRLILIYGPRDKTFASKLCGDLSIYGVEGLLSEDLTEEPLYFVKDNSNLGSVVGVVVSSNDDRYESIRRRIEVAGGDKHTRVIPILLDKQGGLIKYSGTLYADFTSPESYITGFHEIMKCFDCEVTEDIVVYSEGLVVGWKDCSWDALTKEKSTDVVRAGTCAFRAELEGYGGLAFAFTSGINTKHHRELEFFIHGAEQGGQKLKAYVNDKIGNGVRNQVSLEILPPKVWRMIRISLEQLDAVDIKIFKINISDTTGQRQAAFYIDGLRLIAVPHT